MVRPSEAAMAEWQEIDYDNKLWVIPAHKMKKKSNGGSFCSAYQTNISFA